MTALRLTAGLVVSLVLLACGPDASVQVGRGADDALDDGQLALATDAADHSCRVTLRHIERAPGIGGFETHCVAGGSCQYVWQGAVDVATASLSTGARVYVQYKSQDQATWSKKAAAKSAGAPAGFTRYTFRLDTKTVEAGQSLTSLQRAKLEVMPYLRSADGSRLFDHNLVAGDLDSYALVASNSWSVVDDGSVCGPPRVNQATLSFLAGWRQEQHGALVAGAHGTIEFDLNRLTTCRGTHNGFPAWDVVATVRFSPGGQVVQGTVRRFDAPLGVPNNTVFPQPFTFAVPAAARLAEVWFTNTGIDCTGYDSNLDANYQFTVEPRPFAQVAWVGNDGSSLSRDCTATPGVPDPMHLDDYVRERACSFVEAEVYVPGLTDGPAHGEAVLARAELSLDGQALAPQWLSPQGQAGNNLRYRFELPRDLLWYGARWSTLSYTLAFSTDGVSWVREAARSVVRDPTWCNPSWGSCS